MTRIARMMGFTLEELDPGLLSLGSQELGWQTKKHKKTA